MSPRLRLAVASGMALALFGTLVVTQESVGIPRDESVYFDAARTYAGWFDDLGDDFFGALGDETIRRRFSVNREHPALPKILFGLSHRLFTETLGWTDHALGFRLPALGFSALLVFVTFLLGCRLASPLAAFFAAIAMVLTPRHFFHLNLATFDVAATTTWVLAVYCYVRSIESGAPRRWAVFAGLAFGLAISVKHNAYLLPPLLVCHWLLVHGADWWRQGGFQRRLRSIPPAFFSMALLGPLTLFVFWPFLWHHPFERIGWYLGFHAQHVHYAWHFLGDVLRAPPFPVSYPFVVSALTVPLTFFVPLFAGVVAAAWKWTATSVGIRRLFERAGRVAPMAEPAERARLSLLLANGLFPLCLIALPSVPIFGGVKHWMPGMPFLFLLGGAVLDLAVSRWTDPRARAALGFGLVIALCVPAFLATAHFHPHGTAAYNETARGAPGAASLGMQRQYWSGSVTAVLPWLNEHAKPGARIYFHEVTHASFRWYREDGALRRDLRFSSDVGGADLAVYQYHQEFRDHEFQMWTHFGTRRPLTGFYLDEVPLIVVYGPPEADISGSR